jgi:exosortase
MKLPSIREPAGLKILANLALAFKASTITVAVIAIYFQDLDMIFRDALSNESSSHILLIPMILVYLVYRKRKMLRAVISNESVGRSGVAKYFSILSGVLLCATATILYLYGSYTFTPLEYHILTLPIFTAGLILVLFNPQTLRHAIFPVVFLAFLTPPPSEILQKVGSILSVTSTEASNALVNLLGIHSTISSDFGTPTLNIIRPDNTLLPLTVDIACSGIYSLIGFLIFAAFIAFIVRDKLWKKALIFIIGFPLIYLLNILRITLIALIGYQWGPQLALDMFHLLGGWILIFLGTLLLLTIAEKAFKTQIFSKKQRQNICPTCNPPASTPTAYCPSCGRLARHTPTRLRIADITKIMAIALVVALLTSIQTPIFALTQGPAQILIDGQQGNIGILPLMQGYTPRFIYRDREFEEISGQDLSLIFEYVPQDPETKPVWVALEIAETRGPLHPWEVCLVSWPQTHGYEPGVNQLDLRDVTLLENPPIIARYFAFQYKNANQTQLVLYWFESSIFTINNASAQKQVKLSLIAYPDTPEDVPSSEQQLLPFATAMAAYWQPLKTWNAVAMLISRNGLSLAAVTLALLIAAIVMYSLRLREQTKANATAYKKLSKPDQQLINMIQTTETQTLLTVDRLQRTYQEVAKEPIDSTRLEQKLLELEKIGVIRTSIVSRQDQPTQVWKTQITLGFRKH